MLPAVGIPDSVDGMLALVGVGELVGDMAGVGVGLVVGEMVGVAVGLTVGLAEAVGVLPDGVDSKLGSPSAAWTIKVLLRLRSSPLASLQFIVIVCSPSSRSLGGLHFHAPFSGTITSSVMGSDSTVIVISVFGGPSPKNSGDVVKIISPDESMLSSVTVVSSFVVSPETSRAPGVVGASSGRFKLASGRPPTPTADLPLKSYDWPSTISGTGLMPENRI